MDAIALTVEQQFQIRAFEEHVKGLTAEEARSLLVDMHRQMLIKDAWFRQQIGREWGV